MDSTALQKRNIARPILCSYRNVPTMYSLCDFTDDNPLWASFSRGIFSPGSPRAYSCYTSPMRRPKAGFCSQNELCVQGPPQAWALREPWTVRQNTLSGGDHSRRWPRAYCVSHSNFVKVAFDGLEQIDDWARAQASVMQSSKAQTVAAVLTNPSGVWAVRAPSLEMVAQSSDTAYGVRMWRTLSGGLSRCKECSHVEIQSVPAGTQRIIIEAALTPESAGGRLYLASF